jgi:acyl-[acyl-carrier-protein] desaturase
MEEPRWIAECDSLVGFGDMTHTDSKPFYAPDPEMEGALWALYRDFFDKAEKKRRWRIRDDIPWDKCNPNLDPAIADVVETFCAIELYLPDYNSKILPLVRNSKGRAWFYANWGYEESKHSLALSDWLLKSGHRTDEQMTDMENMVFKHEWNLPQDSHLGMLAYAMVQEHATFINYRNLRHRCRERQGDPALEKLLQFVSIDEAAHHDFFFQCFELFLKYDRPSAMDALRRVLNNFSMPAINDLLDNSRKRLQGVYDLELFSPDMFYRDVYLPIIDKLGITRHEMRNGPKVKKSLRIS